MIKEDFKLYLNPKLSFQKMSLFLRTWYRYMKIILSPLTSMLKLNWSYLSIYTKILNNFQQKDLLLPRSIECQKILNFSKAFDTVWRPALLYKILRKGIGGNFFNIIKHMYSTTKCAVRQGNLCSDFFNTTLGVKQGDNLSPTLFKVVLYSVLNGLNHEDSAIK